MKVWKRWFFEQKTTFIIRQMNVKFLSRISKIWKLPHSSGPMTGHGTIKNLYLLNQYFKCMSFEEETNGGEEKTRTVWEIIHLAAHYFFIITGVAGTLRRGEQGDDRQRKMATARKHHRITCKCNARPYFIEKRRRRLRSTEQFFHILFTLRWCCKFSGQLAVDVSFLHRRSMNKICMHIKKMGERRRRRRIWWWVNRKSTATTRSRAWQELIWWRDRPFFLNQP